MPQMAREPDTEPRLPKPRSRKREPARDPFSLSGCGAAIICAVAGTLLGFPVAGIVSLAIHNAHRALFPPLKPENPVANGGMEFDTWSMMLLLLAAALCILIGFGLRHAFEPFRPRRRDRCSRSSRSRALLFDDACEHNR